MKRAFLLAMVTAIAVGSPALAKKNNSWQQQQLLMQQMQQQQAAAAGGNSEAAREQAVRDAMTQQWAANAQKQAVHKANQAANQGINPYYARRHSRAWVAERQRELASKQTLLTQLQAKLKLQPPGDPRKRQALQMQVHQVAMEVNQLQQQIGMGRHW